MVKTNNLFGAVYGIYEETGNNNTYLRNQIIPYPYPIGNGGAQQAPLQSSTADGEAPFTFHIEVERKLRHCLPRELPKVCL